MRGPGPLRGGGRRLGICCLLVFGIASQVITLAPAVAGGQDKASVLVAGGSQARAVLVAGGSQAGVVLAG